MGKVAVVTDSNAGITQEMAKDLGILVVPMPFMFGDSEDVYYEDVNLTREEFFQRLADGQTVHTSQPTPVDVLKVWDKALETSDEVVYIPMSSGLSGSCQSALMLSSEYDGKVQVVNNQRISVTQRASCIDALKLAAKGWNAKQIREKLEEVKFHSSIYIMLDTLTYLKRGGRISAATALVGTMLQIKPVLHVDDEGHLINVSKVRGRKASIEALAKKMGETALPGENDTVFICHGDCIEDARYLEKLVKEKFGVKEVFIGYTGAVIGSHSGPGTLALFFLGEHR